MQNVKNRTQNDDDDAGLKFNTSITHITRKKERLLCVCVEFGYYPEDVRGTQHPGGYIAQIDVPFFHCLLRPIVFLEQFETSFFPVQQSTRLISPLPRSIFESTVFKDDDDGRL